MNRPKRAAILFVHGILGTPRHFAPFLPYVPASWSVCNLLLEGHGGSVRDFSHAAMAQWKQQVHAALDALLTEHALCNSGGTPKAGHRAVSFESAPERAGHCAAFQNGMDCFSWEGRPAGCMDACGAKRLQH